MPLRYAAEPANGTDLVRAGLNRLSTRTSHLTGRGVDVNALQVTKPHAVYDLRADAVANGGGLESAVFSGFRYLVGDGDTAVAAAEVQADTAGNATLLANLNYGPFVAATAQALPKVAALAPVSAGSYEVRALRFAAIGLMALWLKPDSGGADIIYPLAPAPPGLQADEPYTADDFFRAVRPLAQKRAAESGRTTVP
jgi:hypothetical protein